MYYKLTYDMDLLDDSKEEGFIYAEATNMDEIEYPTMKKGFFDRIILKKASISEWPKVEFYFSSKASNRESDYLLNIKRWPIVHERVKDVLVKSNISGIQYYPIDLIDVISGEISKKYFLMYITNFIDAFDMKKSKYKYNQKYDYYTFIPGEIFLSKTSCDGYDIFRCSKSAAGLYVSEKFREIILNHKYTGFAFEKYPIA